MVANQALGKIRHSLLKKVMTEAACLNGPLLKCHYFPTQHWAPVLLLWRGAKLSSVQSSKVNVKIINMKLFGCLRGNIVEILEGAEHSTHLQIPGIYDQLWSYYYNMAHTSNFNVVHRTWEVSWYFVISGTIPTSLRTAGVNLLFSHYFSSSTVFIVFISMYESVL